MILVEAPSINTRAILANYKMYKHFMWGGGGPGGTENYVYLARAPRPPVAMPLPVGTCSGADPGFSSRGGGRKRLRASTHITNAEPNSLSAWVHGPLEGPGSSRVVWMLCMCYLSFMFKYSDFKNDLKK